MIRWPIGHVQTQNIRLIYYIIKYITVNGNPGNWEFILKGKASTTEKQYTHIHT